MLEGVENCLLALTKLAAVYWIIIRPEFNPGFFVKKEGKFLLPDIRLKVLRSEIFPNSEREILVQQHKDSDKPDNILAKIIDGKLNKYLEEIILLKQKFVINPELSIEKYLEEESLKIGSTIKIDKYIRFEIGK